MNKEFEFLDIINKTLDDNSFLGDDCAYLKEFGLAISSDSLIEDVHFSLSYMTPYEIAKKAMLVNISDILASGSTPKYVQISLSGKLDSEFIKEFYSGINEVSREYNIKVTGGDLTKAEKLLISITIIGKCNKQISKRNNAKSGYVVAVAGEFGSSAQGLDDLKNGNVDSYFAKIHKSPQLYPKVSQNIALLAKEPFAMMDSSDGLIDCLNQISTQSNLKIEIEYDKIPHKTQNKDYVLNGGEDYCLVVCLNEKDYSKINELQKIGVCTEGEGVFVDNSRIEYKGFNHFE